MFPLSDSIKSPRFQYLTLLIVLANIYVFFLENSAQNIDLFINKYALIPAYVDFSNPATLLPFFTLMFLHGGLLHLASNMWFLWIFGDNVETHIGGFFYLLLYFGSGLVGGLLQYFLTPGSQVPMLGASGAVAGVLGAYFVLFGHSKIKTLVPFFGFITVMNIPASIMLGYWFLLQVVSGATSLPGSGDEGGVAFFAHIGGFAAGFILAKLFKPAVSYEVERKW